MMSSDKDNYLLEIFFAIATLILVYFIIFQTLFVSQSHLSLATAPGDGVLGKMALNASKNRGNQSYEDWYDLDGSGLLGDLVNPTAANEEGQ